MYRDSAPGLAACGDIPKHLYAPWMEDRAVTFDDANTQSLENRSIAAATAYPFGMMAWVKLVDVGINQAVCGLGYDSSNYHYLIILSTNIARYAVIGQEAVQQTAQVATDLSDGQWHLLLAFSQNVSTHRLSLDGGSFVSATAGNVTIDESYAITAIGVRPGGSFPSGSTIDNVGFFGSVLDNTDASELWNSGSGIAVDRLYKGYDVLTSGRKPTHYYKLSKWNVGANKGRDGVRSGTPIDLTKYGTGTIADAQGIPAGRRPG